jgi:uroporphyrin-3 C-methyltransferase
MSDTQARHNSDRPAPAALPPPGPKSSRRLLLVTLLGAGLLAGGLVLVQIYWTGAQARFGQLQRATDQARVQQDNLRDQLADTQQAFTEQQKQIQAQELLVREQVAKLAAQQQTLAEREARLQQQEETIHQALANLHAELGRSGQEWRAAEAAYLVELAAQRLAFEQDTATARQALQAADVRLGETGDPRWQPIRERIAADLAALDRVRQLDRSGLSARLVRLGQAAVKLPLRSRQGAAEGESPATAERRNLNSLWHDSLEGFMSLVQVRRRDGPDPVPSPEGRLQVRQSLRLQLETARYALLRSDRNLYDASLDSALTWIDSSFDGSAEATRHFRAELEELKQGRIVPELPDLSGTLNALRAQLSGAGGGK